MDRHEEDGVWSERRDRQEWERKRARGNKESEEDAAARNSRHLHTLPPSVHPLFHVLGFAKGAS